MRTYIESRFAKWRPSEIAQSLRACGGSVGGGGEALVIEIHCTGTPPSGLPGEDSKGWHMSEPVSEDGNRGGNVPLVIEIRDAEDNGDAESRRASGIV